ncbi:MAG: ECF transporter S component [Clostridia bacterium]
MNKTKGDEKIRRTVLGALMCAIVVITTMFLAIPIPNITGAYVNMGDAAVYVCAFVLGGPLGAVVAAIGSALADMFLGSFIYAPATFVIKGLMALCAGVLMSRWPKFKLGALLVAGLIMPLGYFLYEWALLGSMAAAAAGLLFNLIQYAGGVTIGIFAISAVGIVGRQKV